MSYLVEIVRDERCWFRAKWIVRVTGLQFQWESEPLPYNKATKLSDGLMTILRGLCVDKDTDAIRSELKDARALLAKIVMRYANKIDDDTLKEILSHI